LGKQISNDNIADILKRLGFDVVFDGDNMHITAPTWRSTGDVSIPDDIMEEVARMYGFENFEPTPITASFTGAINQPNVDIDRKIREYLASRCGMREIFTYPWMHDEYVKATLQNEDELLSLAEAPSPTESYLRSSFLPNICKAVHDNLRFYNEFAIFESATVFYNKDFTAQYDKRELLPMQHRSVAGAFIADYDLINSLFRKAKGVIEALPVYVHIEPVSLCRVEKPKWADDVVWLNICYDGKQIGNLALLAKKVSLDCGIKNSAVMIFEINIDSLKPYPSRTNTFEHLPSYPLIEYDLSLLFDLSVKWDDIVMVVSGKKDADNLVREVLFVDEYRGRQVPDGKKSVSFRLIIGSLSKTLTSEEIEGCANAIVKRLAKRLGAELRS
jgi:phenylalanyl-tRNA synthetase beta chain